MVTRKPVGFGNRPLQRVAHLANTTMLVPWAIGANLRHAYRFLGRSSLRFLTSSSTLAGAGLQQIASPPIITTGPNQVGSTRLGYLWTLTRSMPNHLRTEPGRCSRPYRRTFSLPNFSHAIADYALWTSTQAQTHRYPGPPCGTTWSAKP